MQASRISPERVGKAIEKLKQSEELHDLFMPKSEQTSWWQRVSDASFGSADRSDLDASTWLKGLSEVLPYIVGGAVLICVLGVAVVFAWRYAAKRKRPKAASQQREALVHKQLDHAKRARAKGELGVALRAYWAALVTGLGQGEELAFRPAWTCREMLARTSGRGPDAELLGGLLPRVERLEFGLGEVSEKDVDELAQICEQRLS